MPWLTTLLLAAVSALIIYCIFVAYSSYVSASEKAKAANAPNLGSVELLHPVTNPTLNEQQLEYAGFNVSFNPDLHIPNWVSWKLLGANSEGTEDWSKFMADRNVSGSAEPGDYTGSGYDRGHMCPRADMRWSRAGVKDCYYMTNMCPQTHSLNAGAWKKLETKCREWAKLDSALIIICGPVLTTRPSEFIGESRVAVPTGFFKVIAAPYANPPRAIGFLMPNGKVEGGIQNAAVTVDSVEAVTGHNFFANLPDSIENEIESQCRFHYWSARKVK